MKFKVGDKVKVKDDLIVGVMYGNLDFLSSMEEYKGKEYEIVRVDDYDYCLNTDEIWYFSDEMLEEAGEDENIKIVAVKHVNYNLKPCSEVHYFKTTGKVNIHDIVYCNTCYGLAVCKVIGVYTTLDKVFKLQKLPPLDHIKECRTTLEI